MISQYKNMSQTKRDTLFGIITVLAIFIASLMASDSVMDFLSRMVIFMLFASAVNIILGFGGLRPLGQGTYFGFTAYAYLFMVVRMHMPLFTALILAIVLNLLLAAFIGILCLRSNDDMAFAFMNMGINTLLWTMVQKLQIVGSDTGITGAVRLPFATSTRANFYLCFIVSAICIFLIYLFFKSPFAKVLKGSRENLERLTFLGINTRNVRLIAYIVSSFFCGIAGLLYAMRNMGAFPTMISSNTSLDGLIMCLIGGMYSFFGPIVGAAIITIINVQLPIITNYYQAIAGVIIVLCVLFLQGGLIRDKSTLELEKGKKEIKKKGGAK
ncbi:branched-chain amino acid ABC transporter permease [Anaeropeptidivorans aminofermentans]|uniref:branched-chain amino acid ABC transporter permease n=1 Tax=Anaeropeptidivorans aminofermentans TaxID=2934315 RepID=UPI00202420D5|nr:branched-chain amino acid ABC transporter permease [Anaeropeptidivorans aminofermentans]MBE6011998.1 branched-chain amino acid ABC transporter permease [Lachnospiraceae bacterium]